MTATANSLKKEDDSFLISKSSIVKSFKSNESIPLVERIYVALAESQRADTPSDYVYSSVSSTDTLVYHVSESTKRIQSIKHENHTLDTRKKNSDRDFLIDHVGPLLLPIAVTGIWSLLVCVFSLIKPVAILAPLPNSFTLMLVLGTSISLLTAFRLNTAFDRYNEGSRAWYSLRFNVLNLARVIQVFIKCPQNEDMKKKRVAIRLLIGLMYSVRHLVRFDEPREEGFEDVREFVDGCAALTWDDPVLNMPQRIINEIQRYVLGTGQSFGAMHNSLNTLQDICVVMERIQTTPIPKAYTIHLTQSVYLYLLVLPFQLVPVLGWYSVLVCCMACFTLLGIIETSRAIENPFGDDVHDLPTAFYCDEVKQCLLG